jgi:NAD(P)-dependent dehydrogenase (short-subunit alcohol dehydrogenase family)
MNETLAIIGAGPGMGLAIAKTFGAKGFNVGVQVGHVAIAVFIGQRAGGTPDAIAPLFWELHTKRDEVEKVFMLEGGVR